MQHIMHQHMSIHQHIIEQISSPGTGACTVPPDDTVGRQLVDPWTVRRHNDPMDLVELARQVQTADQFVRATTSGKLQVIVDTIRHLQEQVNHPVVPCVLFPFTNVIQFLLNIRAQLYTHSAKGWPSSLCT